MRRRCQIVVISISNKYFYNFDLPFSSRDCTDLSLSSVAASKAPNLNLYAKHPFSSSMGWQQQQQKQRESAPQKRLASIETTRQVRSSITQPPSKSTKRPRTFDTTGIDGAIYGYGSSYEDPQVVPFGLCRSGRGLDSTSDERLSFAASFCPS